MSNEQCEVATLKARLIRAFFYLGLTETHFSQRTREVGHPVDKNQ